MKRPLVILVVSLVASVCAAQCYATPGNRLWMRGAFLENRADSVNALVREVSQKPSVAARYAHHFGVSTDQIKSYFSRNLKLITLKSPQEVQEYYVARNGKVMLGKRLLPAGSRVFATHDGKLLLEWRCGNPFSKKLPSKVVKVRAKGNTWAMDTPKPHKPTSSSVVATKPMSSMPVAEAPVSVVAETPSQINLFTPETPSEQVPEPAETFIEAQTPVQEAIQPAEPAVVNAEPVHSSRTGIASGISSLRWLAPILIGAGAKLSSSDDSRKPPVVPPAVPEPASVAVLVAGLSATGLVYRFRRK